MNYVAYFNFNDGVGERGPYPLTAALPEEYYCNESFKRTVSQCRISMLPDSEFLTAHAAATGDTLVRIFDDEVLVFKGRLAPTDCWTSNGAALGEGADVTSFDLEVLDYSDYLDRVITDDDGIAWENYSICAVSGVQSITHSLLAICGIVGNLFTPARTDGTIIPAFAPDPGSTVGDVLDSLLFQHGLVLRWVVDHFETAEWITEAPASQLDINENIIMTGLKNERIGREADSVEVRWYALKSKTHCLLAKPYLAYDETSQFDKYPIQPGLLWPEEANVGETWFDYDDTSIATVVSADGQTTRKNTDFSQIVLTKNHYIDSMVDGGIVPAFPSVFRNKRARLAYRNPTEEILNINYCLIYGDAIYRGAENLVTKNIVTAPKKTVSIQAGFVYNDIAATRLACALADQYGSGCWRSSFESESRLDLGCIGRLSDPYSGFSGLVRIIKRTFNPETAIYSYRAISIAPVSITPTAKYSSSLDAPQKVPGEKAASDAAAGTYYYRNNVPPSNNVTNLTFASEANADGSVDIPFSLKYKQGPVPAAGFLVFAKSGTSAPAAIDLVADAAAKFIPASSDTGELTYADTLRALSVRFGGAGALLRHYRFAVVAVSQCSGGAIPHDSGVVEAVGWTDRTFSVNLGTAEGNVILSIEDQSIVFRSKTDMGELARIQYDEATGLVRAGKPGNPPASGLALPVLFSGTWTDGAWQSTVFAGFSSEKGSLCPVGGGEMLYVYTLWSIGESCWYLYEVKRSTSGVFGDITNIGVHRCGDVNTCALNDGRVLAVYLDTDTNTISYRIRSTAGGWGVEKTTYVLGATRLSNVAVLKDGRAVCAVRDLQTGNTFLLTMNSLEEWSAWDTPVTDNAYTLHVDVLEASGALVLSYSLSTGQLYYCLMGVNWSWGTLTMVTGVYMFSRTSCQLPDGRLWIIGVDTSHRVVLASRTSDGVWSSAVSVIDTVASQNACVLMASTGEVLLLMVENTTSRQVDSKLYNSSYGGIAKGTFFKKAGMGVVEHGLESSNEYLTLGDGTKLYVGALKAALGSGWSTVLAAAYGSIARIPLSAPSSPVNGDIWMV